MTNIPESNEASKMIKDSEMNEKRSFLLNQDKFELLMKVQREIEEETEMRPTFKKWLFAFIRGLVHLLSASKFKHFKPFSI